MKRFFLLLLILFPIISFAQLEKPVKWSYKATKLNKAEAILYLKATMAGNWHIYSLNVKGIPAKTRFTFLPSKDFTLLGKPVEPKPITHYDKVLKSNLTYFEKEVIFTQKIKLNKNQTVVRGKVEFMACNDKSCLPSDEVTFSIPVK